MSEIDSIDDLLNFLHEQSNDRLELITQSAQSILANRLGKLPESPNPVDIMLAEVHKLSLPETRTVMLFLIERLVELAQGKIVVPENVLPALPTEPQLTLNEEIYSTTLILRYKTRALNNPKVLEQAINLRAEKIGLSSELVIKTYRKTRETIRNLLIEGGAVSGIGKIYPVNLTDEVQKQEFRGKSIKELFLIHGWFDISRHVIHEFNIVTHATLTPKTNYVLFCPDFINQFVVQYSADRKNAAFIHLRILGENTNIVTMPDYFLINLARIIYKELNLDTNNPIITPGAMVTLILYEIGDANYRQKYKNLFDTSSNEP